MHQEKYAVWHLSQNACCLAVSEFSTFHITSLKQACRKKSKVRNSDIYIYSRLNPIDKKVLNPYSQGYVMCPLSLISVNCVNEKLNGLVFDCAVCGFSRVCMVSTLLPSYSSVEKQQPTEVLYT